MFRSLGALNSAVENEEDSSHSRASKRIGRAVSRAQGPLRKSSDDLDLREAKKTWWGPLHDTKGPVWSGIEGQSGRREFPPPMPCLVQHSTLVPRRDLFSPSLAHVELMVVRPKVSSPRGSEEQGPGRRNQSHHIPCGQITGSSHAPPPTQCPPSQIPIHRVIAL